MSQRLPSPSTKVLSGGDFAVPAKRPRLSEEQSPPDTIESSKASGKVQRRKRKRKLESLSFDSGSHDDVHWQETIKLLGLQSLEVEDALDVVPPFKHLEEVSLVITALSSNGDGLAVVSDRTIPWVVVVPFALPAEQVRVRIYRHSRFFSLADLLDVEKSNDSMRNMDLVKCKYFGKCSGCQYQMLTYDSQLELKRDVVVKAYETFSGLPESAIPHVLPTAPSPLIYGYRTKITPHFEIPSRKKKQNITAQSDAPVNIGFNLIGRKEVMDIEECPIATTTINATLGMVRNSVHEKISTYKKGASLLLRDSLVTDTVHPSLPPNDPQARPDSGSSEDQDDQHVCVTDHTAIVRERVGDMKFEFPGGLFFQNNNSILPSLVSHVKSAIFPTEPKIDSCAPSPRSAATSITRLPTESSDAEPSIPTHLVDAYCGSGFFSILLSPYFSTVVGIEIASDSIRWAKHNADTLNRIPPGRCTFHAGEASTIFASVSSFPPSHTAVIIDPPRKGCDERFIDQLVAFRPTTVVYVSCNVHTQARDVGSILRKTESSAPGGRYRLTSLKGFDLFPQTAHVESIAVLRLY